MEDRLRRTLEVSANFRHDIECRVQPVRRQELREIRRLDVYVPGVSQRAQCKVGRALARRNAAMVRIVIRRSRSWWSRLLDCQVDLRWRLRAFHANLLVVTEELRLVRLEVVVVLCINAFGLLQHLHAKDNTGVRCACLNLCVHDGSIQRTSEVGSSKRSHVSRTVFAREGRHERRRQSARPLISRDLRRTS